MVNLGDILTLRVNPLGWVVPPHGCGCSAPPLGGIPPTEGVTPVAANVVKRNFVAFLVYKCIVSL